MTDLIQFLNSMGIHVSESNSPMFMFVCVILVLSIIALLCFLQILFYMIVIYVSEQQTLLDKISKYPILFKLFKIYKQTRIGYLFFEVLLFLFSLGSIIWLCLRLVYGLM